jgi:hypothetical protein
MTTMSSPTVDLARTHKHNHALSTMVVDHPWKQLHLLLLSVVLLISSQQPIAVQYIKNTTKSTLLVTCTIVYSALTAIRDEASKMRNKWMPLDAWKTIMYHYYDIDDQLGFKINCLTTRVVKLFGTEVDSKVCEGNTTGVHLCLMSFVQYNKNGKILEHKKSDSFC